MKLRQSRGGRALPLLDPFLGDLADVEAAQGARLLVLAGRLIGEPVARRGPFVMNIAAELDRAVADYRSGRLVDGRSRRRAHARVS